ncbi:hypothetical protein LTR56_005466 [Elasticomyces elasticus]|nr:hypothetical protein LTR56_005466 [Elasticomyces elasticus]KAK3665410.1 hypothetical protein LTR22_003640 [Elasticomyces elasticus]KAK4929946.1 hypothetical protein LTR49_003573 [Elasticomyces elasticus]KAK5769244.1 hypothetical protein LTS12_000595 [Elasticomyces elasticus]
MATNGEEGGPRKSMSNGRSSAVDSALGALGIDDESMVVPIATHGDLVLQIEHEIAGSSAHASFRVSASALKQSSRYFERLLQSGRFGEGVRVEALHKTLKEQYRSMDKVPVAELPVVQVQDVGRTSAIKSLTSLCADLLHILHGQDIQTNPLVSNLANLSIVADRFDALHFVGAHIARKKFLRTIDGKTTAKAEAALSEEKVRQRLLVAVMLDHRPWIERYSARLIIKGWVGGEADLSTPLWWDLPSRIEEELAYRRECVLETIQSIQSYFLGLYTSRERRCKLGYDSSTQCDSYQLGEMIRFFVRNGTLKLQGGVVDNDESSEQFTGDATVLLESLRQVPEYQIDRHHSHCGIRTQILPLLDLLGECLLRVGICGDCWTDSRAQYAWMDAKKPLLWKRQAFSLRGQGHANHHADLRAMFTATDRDWGQ